MFTVDGMFYVLVCFFFLYSFTLFTLAPSFINDCWAISVSIIFYSIVSCLHNPAKLDGVPHDDNCEGTPVQPI